MEKYKAELETMCKRCINYDVCQGTGCGPKKDLAELIKGVELEEKAETILKAFGNELGKNAAAYAEALMQEEGDQERQIKHLPELERRLEYAKRIRKAVDYKGTADHEDVQSILCKFQEEIIKEFTDRIVEQLEAMQNFEMRTGKSYCPDADVKNCRFRFSDLSCSFCAFDKAIAIVKGVQNE